MALGQTARGVLFLSSDCGFFNMDSSIFQKYPPISGEAGGEQRGQKWHVIMACHFSSTFPTMHDPDWSQNTHLHRNTSLGSEGRAAS